MQLHTAEGLPALVASHDSGSLSLIDAHGKVVLQPSGKRKAQPVKDGSLHWCRVLQLRGAHRGSWLALSVHSTKQDSISIVVSKLAASGKEGGLASTLLGVHQAPLRGAATQAVQAAFNKTNLTLSVSTGDNMVFLRWPLTAAWFEGVPVVHHTCPAGLGDATLVSRALYSVEPSTLVEVACTSAGTQIALWDVVHCVGVASAVVAVPGSGQVHLCLDQPRQVLYFSVGSHLCQASITAGSGTLASVVGAQGAPVAVASSAPLSFAAALLGTAAACAPARRGKKRTRSPTTLPEACTNVMAKKVALDWWDGACQGAASAEAAFLAQAVKAVVAGQGIPDASICALGTHGAHAITGAALAAAAKAGALGESQRVTLKGVLKSGAASHQHCPDLLPALLREGELVLLRSALQKLPDVPEAFLVAATLAPSTAPLPAVREFLAARGVKCGAAGEDDRLLAVQQMLHAAVQCGRNDVTLSATLRTLSEEQACVLLGALLCTRAAVPEESPVHSACLDWARLLIDSQLATLAQAASSRSAVAKVLGAWQAAVQDALVECQAAAELVGPLAHITSKAPVPEPAVGAYSVAVESF